MDHYYVNDNAQSDGYHEVHKKGCYYLGQAKSTTHLGYFGNCHDAVNMAKNFYTYVDGCAHCCRACHTR